jgi:hypothetical protein
LFAFVAPRLRRTQATKAASKAASAEKVPTVVDTFYNLVVEGTRWVGLEVATRQSWDSTPVAPPSPPHPGAREGRYGRRRVVGARTPGRVGIELGFCVLLRKDEERGRREDERGGYVLLLTPRRRPDLAAVVTYLPSRLLAAANRVAMPDAEEDDTGDDMLEAARRWNRTMMRRAREARR